MDNPVSQSLLRKAPWLEAKGVRFDDTVVGYMPGVFGASDGIRATELVLLTQIARGIDVALRKEVMRFQKQNLSTKRGGPSFIAAGQLTGHRHRESPKRQHRIANAMA